MPPVPRIAKKESAKPIKKTRARLRTHFCAIKYTSKSKGRNRTPGYVDENYRAMIVTAYTCGTFQGQHVENMKGSLHKVAQGGGWHMSTHY